MAQGDKVKSKSEWMAGLFQNAGVRKAAIEIFRTAEKLGQDLVAQRAHNDVNCHEYKNNERQRRQLTLQYITSLERKSSETGKIIDTLPAMQCI